MADRQTMDPRSGNHPALLPGEIVAGASGWKARERSARGRLQKKDEDERAEIRAARAKLIFGETAAPVAQVAAETDGGDYLTKMAWADLRALYAETLGEKPGGQMKRGDIEAAIRDAKGSE